MLRNQNFLYLKKHSLIIFSTILWLYLCSTINATPLSLTNFLIIFNNENINVINKLLSIFNFLRSHTIFFIPLLLVTFIFLIDKFKSNIFLNCYLIFFICQTIGTLMLMEYSKLNYARNFLLFNSFNLILILYFYWIFKLNKFINFLLSLTIMLLLVVLICHLYFLIIEYINDDTMFYFYSASSGKLILGNAFSKATGLSRSLVIVLIFYYFWNFYKSKNLIMSILFYLLFFIIIFYIWFLQSRTSLYVLPIIFVLIYILLYERKYLKKILYSFSILIISFLVIYLITPKIFYLKKIFNANLGVSKSLKKKEYVHHEISQIFLHNNRIIDSKFDLIAELQTKKNKKKDINNVDLNIWKKSRFFITKNISSSRFIIWKTMLSKYDLKKFFGYGSQADRFELAVTQSENKYRHIYNNSSNAFVYSFLCGGYPGLLIFIWINLFVLKRIFLIFLNKKKYTDNAIVLSSTTIIFFLMVRSLVENNHANFSLDLVIFALCSTIIINETNKLNNKKINFFLSAKNNPFNKKNKKRF